MTSAEISIQLELEFGDRYTGEASLQPNHRWIPHGRGALSSPHGHSYDGQFVNRMREGEGTLSVAGLFTMRSKWRANRPDLSSPVAVEYADGSTYRGYVQLRPALPAEVAAARPCGANMSTFSRWVRSIRLARTRTGEWRNRLRGSRYLGDWMDDLPCGFGTFIDGGWTSRYTGELRSGLFHGIGTLCAFEWSSEGWRAPTGPCGVSCMGDGVHICGGVSPCVVNGRWREGAVDGECATTLPLGESLYVESSRVHGVATRQQMDDCSGAREWRMWDALFHRKGDAEHLRLVHQYAEKLAATHYTSNAEWVGVLSQFLSTSAVFDFAHRVFTVHFLFCHDHRPLPRDFTEEANVLLRQTSRMWVALGDIVAFTQSTLRWLTSIFGNATADNLAECAHQISMFIADRVFPRLHPLLLRLYREAFWSEEAHLASATSLELDNCMSKTESSATCFPDLAATEVLHLFSSAMSILDELHTEPKTLTALFQTVLRWSVEVERVSRQHLSTSCLSMDELLPIQEFLLHRCQTPHLYAHAKLLVDLASKDFLVSAASPECYSSTTVFACLSSIIEFHSSHNSNGSQSGAPHSDDVTALNKALASMIEDAQNCALCANDSLISSTPSASALVKGYVKSWIPCILRCFSPEACGSVSGECAHDISSFGCLPDNDCIVAVAELVAMKSNSLRVLCWAFADKVLQRVGVRLRLTWMNDGESPALATDVFSSIVGDASNSFQNVCGENPHCRLSIIHFSHSHYDSVAMKDLANVLDFSL